MLVQVYEAFIPCVYLVLFVCVTIYCIAQNFNRGNFVVFDAFQLDRQNLTHQIVKQYVTVSAKTLHVSIFYIASCK